MPLCKIRISIGAIAPPQARPLANRRIFWPRGRVLSGSSSLNYLVYVRGTRADFDQLQARGNLGCGYDDVLP